jgi:hypothetical protein
VGITSIYRFLDYWPCSPVAHFSILSMPLDSFIPTFVFCKQDSFPNPLRRVIPRRYGIFASNIFILFIIQINNA